jgi:hypothetical protein
MAMASNRNQDSVMSMLAMGAEADWAWVRDELAFAWRSAQDEALSTYRAWSMAPGRTAYVVYRAAQDRADQAQNALAAHRRPASASTFNEGDRGDAGPFVKTSSTR